MGIEFSKRAVIRVIMDAMAGLDSLKDIYDKVEAMEEPTQPELVEVPPCADVFLNNGNKELNLAYLISCKRNFLSCEMREGELKQWLRNTSLHDLLSLAKGYTVKKEQLYWAVMGVTDYFKCDGKIIVFTKEEEAVEVANLIGINTRAEQLEWHEHSDCILIDELRATL